MPESPPPPIDTAAIFAALRAGDTAADDRLFTFFYNDLRRAAAGLLRRESPNATIEPTALVHEAFMKLAGATDLTWEGRAHFLGVAARAMRQILVDQARRRRAAKRGGEPERVRLTLEPIGVESRVEELLALNDALDRLDALEPRLRRIVELRFFAGLTEDEIAELLGVTARTVQRDWVRARAWLYADLYPDR